MLEAIENHPQESRKEWLHWMFERAAKKNPTVKNYQFWQQHNKCNFQGDHTVLELDDLGFVEVV